MHCRVTESLKFFEIKQEKKDEKRKKKYRQSSCFTAVKSLMRNLQIKVKNREFNDVFFFVKYSVIFEKAPFRNFDNLSNVLRLN